ncbi:MAG: L,D-transpeptidase family protein [Sphingomonas sp.]|uniref:L,D-transpeptidase family protein n=1 Tax=Sphingomonas sp. TaxID=28214 RepID=UPI001B0D10EF|nr:L,D-transpeptidase family protein [Sphingomonas sp.]MBO9622679.1 L,D-transpeptidase family protein [Sphingomonas sp.]
MRTGPSALIALALLAALPATPAVAQAAEGTVQPDTHPLKPGQFVWHEQPAQIAASTATEPLSLVVSLVAQRAYLYRGGRLLAETTVSTGAPGYDTPTGEFTILQKQAFHRSNLYSDAPMPHMQRLTWDGIALHGGYIPGRPASHGCVRLPVKFARQLFDLTPVGSKVTIVYDLLEAAEPYAPPQINAQTEGLGGQAYDRLTMSGNPPADTPAASPASWVAGEAKP